MKQECKKCKAIYNDETVRECPLCKLEMNSQVHKSNYQNIKIKVNCIGCGKEIERYKMRSEYKCEECKKLRKIAYGLENKNRRTEIRKSYNLVCS